MTRNICWSFTPITPGQSVYIVTCPRLIEALLNPSIQPDELGNYGPYVDSALSTIDADEEPGIFHGTAISVRATQATPFAHALVTVEADLGRLSVLTGPLFDEGMKPLNEHYKKFPWKKPLPVKRGQSALDAMLEETLGDQAALFKEPPVSESADPGAMSQDFLGIALPENDTSNYLLKVVMNLLLYEIMVTTFLEIEAKPPC